MKNFANGTPLIIIKENKPKLAMSTTKTFIETKRIIAPDTRIIGSIQE